jgi:hypothetical protein
MIVREILVTRKLGVKHIVKDSVPEWYGGHPVFPATATNTVIQRQPGFIGEKYDYTTDSGVAVGGILTSDPAGQITAAFSGEYDWKDFLYFSQPVVTTGSGHTTITVNSTDYEVPSERPIGLAMHSSKIRPTEFGLPDSKDFVTVLFFPCTVTIAMDASEKKMFDANVIDITLNSSGPTYVWFEYFEYNATSHLYVFKITNAPNASVAVGAVLAGDKSAGIYTIEFWG